jgi:hypothetical protein
MKVAGLPDEISSRQRADHFCLSGSKDANTVVWSGRSPSEIDVAVLSFDC